MLRKAVAVKKHSFSVRVPEKGEWVKHLPNRLQHYAQRAYIIAVQDEQIRPRLGNGESPKEVQEFLNSDGFWTALDKVNTARKGAAPPPTVSEDVVNMLAGKSPEEIAALLQQQGITVVAKK